MATRLLAELSRRTVVRRAVLTPREKDVLAQLARGKPCDEVAAALGTAEVTVRGHLKRVVEKLHLESRAHVALRALSQRVARPTADGGAS
jgi:DNA-binding CsgD family transcriptional regulator